MFNSNGKKSLFIFLSQLNNADLDWIVQKGQLKILPSGSILVQEGKQIDAIYIVLKGKLQVFISGDKDKEIGWIGSGEIVGEISFIDTRPPLATVEAIEPTEVLAIPRIHLSQKLQMDPSFASRFYHGISLCMADRMRGTIRLLGYGEDIDELYSMASRDEIDPSLIDEMTLSQAKFNWLLQSISILDYRG